MRQSERGSLYAEAAERALASGGAERDDDGAVRLARDGTTLLRADGSATYQLASVVDDLDLGITHVIRGSDHRPNLELQQRIARAVGGRAARGDPSRARARAGRQEALEAARALLDLRASRGGLSGERRAGVPGRARHARARRAARPSAAPTAGGRRDRGDDGRGARPRRWTRRSRSRRCFAARGRWPRRGTTHTWSRDPASPVELPPEARADPRALRRAARGVAGAARSCRQLAAPSASSRRSAETCGRCGSRSRARRPAGARGGARGPSARGSPRPRRPRNRALTRRYDRRVRLYDTYTRGHVELPSPPGPIRMYVCGSTVYQRIHVGNSRPVRPRHVAPQLAARDGLRRDARAQHHRRRRQGLRRGREAGNPEPRARRPRDGVVLRGHGRSRPRPTRHRAARDRDDPGDHRVHPGSARAGHGLRGERRRLLPRRALPRVRTALRARSSRR